MDEFSWGEWHGESEIEIKEEPKIDDTEDEPQANPYIASGGVPEGFKLIKPTLNQFEHKLRVAGRESTSSKKSVESTWPIMVLIHQKARFVYEMYRAGRIDEATLKYCLDQELVSATLIERWETPGYEKLCCVGCIDTKATNFGTVCLCRVPKSKLDANKVVECRTCGCKGCATKNS